MTEKDVGMSPEVVREAGEVVVFVRGELDMASAPALWEVLAGEIPGTKRLVVDLKDTTFIDSSGLSIFVRALRRLRYDGGDLVLRSLRPSVHEVFRITGLDQVLTVER
ncbi:MAG TPA: STAS domain-containing protein [Acidimicrobiia bacterium]|nr:STAS domain-containing protein [Acidimicrobiia bacterium]